MLLTLERQKMLVAILNINFFIRSFSGEVEMLRVLPISDCMPLIPFPRDWHSPIDRTDEFDLHEVHSFDENEVEHREEMKSEEDAERKMGWY